MNTKIFRRDEEKQSLRVVRESVLRHSRSSPWTVKRWAPQTDIIEDVTSRAGYRHLSDGWVRNKLNCLLDEGKVQTVSYSGRRFYADTTYSFSYPLAAAFAVMGWLSWLFLSSRLPPLYAYPAFLSPILYVVVDRVMRQRHDTGVCIECGMVIANGDVYCSESCRSHSSKTDSRKKKEEGSRSKREIDRLRKTMPVETSDMNG